MSKKKSATTKKSSKKNAVKRKHRANVATVKSIPASARRVEAAIRKFDRAQQIAAHRAGDLLAIATALGDAAVAKHKRKLVNELAGRELLRDILALKDAFEAALSPSLPPEFEQLRFLPDALIHWLADSFELVPSTQQGELEVPAGKLSSFLCDFQPPEDPDQLVAVSVTSRGWRRRSRSIVPPHVELAVHNNLPSTPDDNR